MGGGGEVQGKRRRRSNLTAGGQRTQRKAGGLGSRQKGRKAERRENAERGGGAKWKMERGKGNEDGRARKRRRQLTGRSCPRDGAGQRGQVKVAEKGALKGADAKDPRTKAQMRGCGTGGRAASGARPHLPQTRSPMLPPRNPGPRTHSLRARLRLPPSRTDTRLPTRRRGGLHALTRYVLIQFSPAPARIPPRLPPGGRAPSTPPAARACPSGPQR